jgi:hypothetical protein
MAFMADPGHESFPGNGDCRSVAMKQPLNQPGPNEEEEESFETDPHPDTPDDFDEFVGDRESVETVLEPHH